MIIPTQQLAEYLVNKTQYDYKALFDISTKHLVVFSMFNSTLLTLKNITFDYVGVDANIIKNLQIAEYRCSTTEVLPENTTINFAIPWIYKYSGNSWEKTAIDALPQEIVDKYYITQQKAMLLDNIYASVDFMLKLSAPDNYLQELIYSIKYQQAQDVLTELVDPVSEPGRCSMVANYADLMGLTLTEAANQIIVQHKLYTGLLAEQEHFRLKFIKQVKEATTIEELADINNNLIRETYWYYRG